MKILSPMSEQDEAELRSQREDAIFGDDDDDDDDTHDHESNPGADRIAGRWQKKFERAVTKLSAEVAALREQISTGREWKSKKEKSYRARLGWIFWIVAKHAAVDLFLLGIVLLWMRRRKDRRLEDHVRGALAVVREYIRSIVPARG
jgi:hypothetical protein